MAAGGVTDAPPHDLAAERCVLAAELTFIEIAKRSVGRLSGADFYSTAHGRIHEAVRELIAANRTPDIVSVAQLLRADGSLDEMGGNAFIAEVVAGGGSSQNAMEHIELVASLARRRRVQVHLHHAARAIAAGDHAEFHRRRTEIEAEVAGGLHPGGQREIPYLNLHELMANPRPIPWIMDGIVAQGDVVFLAAGAGIGKTWFDFDAGIALTSGRPWLGAFQPLTTGPVTILDQENSVPLISQRLVKLWGQPEPPPGLRYLHFPGIKLRNPAGLDYLKRIIDDGPMAIVMDTFSKFSGAKENDADEITQAMDAINTMAKSNNVAFIVLHHFGKDDGKKSATQLVRGSSAIVDNCDQVFAIKRDPRGLAVEQIKARQGKKVDGFLVQIRDTDEDVMIAGKKEPRVEVVVIGSPEPRKSENQSRTVADVVARLITETGKHPRRIDVEKQLEPLGWHYKKIDRAIKRAVEDGRLGRTEIDSNGGIRYFVVKA